MPGRSVEVSAEGANTTRGRKARSRKAKGAAAQSVGPGAARGVGGCGRGAPQAQSRQDRRARAVIRAGAHQAGDSRRRRGSGALLVDERPRSGRPDRAARCRAGGRSRPERRGIRRRAGPLSRPCRPRPPLAPTPNKARGLQAARRAGPVQLARRVSIARAVTGSAGTAFRARSGLLSRAAEPIGEPRGACPG